MRHPLLLSLGALAALGLLIGCDERTPVPTRTELTMVGTISY